VKIRNIAKIRERVAGKRKAASAEDTRKTRRAEERPETEDMLDSYAPPRERGWMYAAKPVS